MQHLIENEEILLSLALLAIPFLGAFADSKKNSSGLCPSSSKAYKILWFKFQQFYKLDNLHNFKTYKANHWDMFNDYFSQK